MNDTNRPVYDTAATIQQMQESLDVMAGVALPEECTEEFAPIHHNIWALLTAAVLGCDRLLKYAVGLPRGHAKTYLLKLLCLFIILFTDKKYILVVCATATKAEEFIEDVVGLLDRQNIITLFGDWLYLVTLLEC